MGEVTGAILHWISGGGRWGRFPNDAFNVHRIINEILIPEKVSYHYLIGEHGSIFQLVPESKQAWHAGRSYLHGRKYCNSFCLGIAFASVGNYPPAQIRGAVLLLRYLMKKYKGLKIENIAGHDHVRAAWNEMFPRKSAHAKQDPGKNFPWSSFLSAVEGFEYV